ncbi:ATP-binding protein [Nocardioides sp. SOB77]|uniref:histidine kinase n=1 Tax=Nocardioides oceani TaxID=3058369 RepID=A0ABT8FIT8_9ACTN|nr:ATP-binding protein [Nocardioides oceani]MDN4174444.1 ATP-binding protein [Nocardioides oceani]
MRDLDDLRPADAVRALVVTGDPDARVLQTAFAFFVATDFAIRSVGSGDVELTGWPGAGLVLTLVTTVLAVLVPWERLRPGLVAVLPVVDIAALGAVRLDPEGSAAGILVVIPALWLGRQLGRRGAVVAVVAVVLLTALPSMIVLGEDPLAVSRALLITVVAGWSALAIAYGLERIRCERDAAEQRGRELAEALGRIEEHQRAAQAIFDAVDVGLVLLDRDGAYRDFNRRHAEFLQRAYPDGHQGLAGQTGLVYDADGATPLTPVETPTARATAGEEFEDCRIWVGQDPIDRRALSVSARSLRGTEGTFEGAALAYKDVTELMRAMAIKDDFVAMVSHELRTPLTSIAGYVEMLQDRPDLPDGVAGQLQVVDRNAHRLLRLISDLLDSAQHAAGPVPLVRRPCDLAAVVRDAAEAAAPAARSAGLALELDLPDELPCVVDAFRVAQVVDNLVSNAVKYTPGGGTVRVHLDADPTHVRIAVTDTGVGIAPADRDRLFTRFFRSRDAEDRSIQGVGLGLSIARSIVEAHGGRIEVESQVGVGSTFRVRLPLAT